MQEITSRDNGSLKRFLALCREKKERERNGLCVLDGVKICRDAVVYGHRLKQLWVSKDASDRYSDEVKKLADAADELFMISDSAAQKLSELNSPQGIFAVVEIPAAVSVDDIGSHSRILGICSLQNPENVGSCIRSAAALGFDSLLVSTDCADVWSPRAIRAASGTQFSCRISFTDDFAASVRQLRSSGVLTCASALHRDSVPVTEIKTDRSLFLAVGNEGRGLPEETVAACEKMIHIPMSGSAESLNAAAAAAVMMWELRDGSLHK